MLIAAPVCKLGIDFMSNLICIYFGFKMIVTVDTDQRFMTKK